MSITWYWSANGYKGTRKFKSENNVDNKTTFIPKYYGKIIFFFFNFLFIQFC